MPTLHSSTRDRIVKAVHGLREPETDPAFEIEMSSDLRNRLERESLLELYRRFSTGDSYPDAMMRRICFRALARSFGHGVHVGVNVGLRHPETFEIGDYVFIGEQTILQGRFDGRCVIGNSVWIGPQSYFDARDLVIENNVGWGPGAKVLGSQHTGVPTDIPIIRTDLRISTVHIGNGSDIGVNAVIMPGVSVGRDSIVGAGAVVTKDVPPMGKVAGVPAQVIGWRTADAEAQHSLSPLNLD